MNLGKLNFRTESCYVSDDKASVRWQRRKLVFFGCLSTRSEMCLLQSLESPDSPLVRFNYVCLGDNRFDFSLSRSPSYTASPQVYNTRKRQMRAKMTAILLSSHAAVSQTDIDETESIPSYIPLSKCDIDVLYRSKSQCIPLSSTQLLFPTQSTKIRVL